LWRTLPSGGISRRDGVRDTGEASGVPGVRGQVMRECR